MSIEQLKAALARKKAGRSTDAGKDTSDKAVRSPGSQVTNKQPAKRSAGRGR